MPRTAAYLSALQPKTSTLPEGVGSTQLDASDALRVFDLYKHSIAPDTYSRYEVAWIKFLAFLQSRHCPLAKLTPGLVGVYLSQVFAAGYSGSGIAGIASALAFFLPLVGKGSIMSDPVVKRVAAGARKARPTVDVRAPFARAEVYALCDALLHLNLSQYDVVLFRGMFLLAFFGMLRVSELVGKHALQRSAVTISRGCVKIAFSNYKHKKGHLPTVVMVQPSGDDRYCPVKVIHDLLAFPVPLDPTRSLFCFADGKPVSPRFFSAQLKQVISVALPGHTRVLSSHSFRIGGATDAVLRGIPVHVVQQMGRWSSSAWQSYVRPFLF